MKTSLNLLAAAVLATMAGCGMEEAADSAAAKENRESAATVKTSLDSMDFIEVTDNVDLNNERNTSLSIETSWSDLKGKEVTWSAVVVDVRGGRGRAEIYAKKDGKPLYDGYNLVINTFDPAEAGRLRKGDTLVFKGLFENRKQRQGGPLILYIGNAEVLSIEEPADQ